MTAVLELLRDLTSRGGALRLVEGKLRVAGAPEVLTKSLRDTLREHRDALSSYLSQVDAGTAAQYLSSEGERGIHDAVQLLRFPQAYNIPFALRLRGALDVPALDRALALLARRHPPLRTLYLSNAEGLCRQVVDAGPALQLYDASDAADATAAAALRLQADAVIAFALDHEPPVRFTLVRLGPDLHELQLVAHHIVFEIWSLRRLLEDLANAYCRLHAGASLPDWEPDPAYARLDALQLATPAWLSPAQREQARAWYEDAPTDQLALSARRGERSGMGDCRYFDAPAGTWQRVETLAAQLPGATAFHVLFSAYAIFIGTLSHRNEVLIGSPVVLRGGDSADVIGYHVRLGAVRQPVDRMQSFAGLVQALRGNWLDAMEWQDATFDTIKRLCPELRELSPPDHGISFSYLPLELALPAFDGVRCEVVNEDQLMGLGPRGTSKFDFGLYARPVHGALRLAFEFNAAVAERGVIEAWQKAFLHLLEHLLAQPQAPIASLPSQWPSDPAPAAVAWQRPSGEDALDVAWCQQVQATPDAIAVIADGQHWTYAQLDARANRLARHLQAHGIRRGDLVGLCLPRGNDAITALLATVLAGAAYVPLDPDQPAERLAEILHDAGLLHLVSDEAHLDALDPTTLFGLDLISLDGDPDWLTHSDQPLPPSLSGEDLAYLVYTSGSTGRAKGVAVPHRGVVRLVRDSDYHRGGPGRRLGHAATLAFDAATFEIWGALLTGAAVVVLSKHDLLDPDRLRAACRDHAIDTLFLTTALFNHCVEQLGEVIADLDTVLFGGEQVDPDAVRALLDRHGRVRVLHVYGPTENTTFSSWHPVDAVAPDAATVPIGRALSRSSCLVLDPYLNPVPAGVDGELYVGGAGLARGYWAQPATTAERFLPHPWQPGERLYRTGDLVRWNVHGQLEFVGRRDHQVKLRGYRIELGEIEVALLRHPQVHGTCTQVRELGGRRQLVAWCQVEGPLGRDELKRFVRQHLPEYMVPSVLVTLAQLPLNANGKIDRDRLPDPEADTAHDDAYTAPRDPREAAIAQVWASVLKRERVGIHDNFFELGGDSLLAIQAKAETQQQGLQFELALLFEYPTIAELAPHVQAADGPAETLAPFALLADADRARLPEGLEDAYPASHLQLGMLYHGSLRVGEDIYHELISYRLRLPFDANALQAAIDALVARHPILRTGFELSRYSEPLQCVYAHAQVPLQIHDLRELPLEAQQARLLDWAAREQATTLPREQAPLLRVSAHRLSETEFQFTYSAHHAIWDGWSESLLTTELLGDYQARLHDEVTVRPPLRTAYRDFIALEQQALRDSASETFWRQQLAGHSAQRLADRSPAPDAAFTGTHDVMVALDADDSARLHALAQHLGVSIKHVLLAAHLKVQSLYSGQADVVTGLVTNGRPETVDGTELVGLFLNTVPLRLQLSVEPWSDLVLRVYAAEQALLPHRRYPLPDIMRLAGGQPLFDVLFNYTHFRKFEAAEVADTEAAIVARQGNVNSSVPLSVNFSSENGRLGGAVTAHHGHFSAQRAQAIAAALEQVLQAMASKPNAPHGDLLVAPSLLHGAPAGDAQPLQSVVRTFQDVALRHPQRVAARIGRTDYSYGALATQVATLATQLQALDVCDGVVAICVDRSEASLAGGLAAQLAVMSAGAAFLPLDPEYPAARLEAMLADAGADVVLASPKAQMRLNFAAQGCRVLDPSWQATSPSPTAVIPWLAPVAGAAELERVAYLMYTSGSTGRPKGVAVTHAGLASHVRTIIPTYGLTADDRVLQLTSWSFDPSIEQLYPTWCAGACVCLPQDTTPTAQDLLRYVREERVTIANATPTYVRELVASVPQELAAWMHSSLRLFIVGGEALARELVADWHALAGDAGPRLVNAYGPTEATIAVSLQDLDALAEDAVAPIGRANAGRTIQILDAGLTPVPVGVIGEIYLGGDGLAQGYHRRPCETASAFLPDPRGTAGARMYRTGDLAWADGHGQLHYVGRADEQIKLRGYRIEPGEIESACLDTGAVAEAVVRLVDREAGGALALYVVVPQGPAFDALALAQTLRRALPYQSRPRYIVALPALPRLPNGKLDRNGLPLPSAADHVAATAVGIPPKTPVQEALLSLWNEVLPTAASGIDDDFHDLGGNSLLAIRLVARIRSHWQREVPIGVLFDHPTVRTLADWLETAPRDGDVVPVDNIPRQPLEPERAYPLAPNQAMLWYAERMGHADSAYHLSSHIRLRGTLDLEAMARAVQRLVDRHEVLRTTYADEADGACQWVHRSQVADFAVFELAAGNLTDPQVRARIVAEAERPFDLRRQSPLRVRAWQLGAQDVLLQIVVHHIGCDGWSLDLLAQELLVLMQPQAPAPADPPSARYVDLACWLAGAGRALRDRDLGYWRRQLADAGRLPLVLPANQARRSTTLALDSETDLDARLQRYCYTHQATPFAVIAAATAAVLSSHFGERDFILATPAANREWAQFEDVVGFFANLLPLRCQIEGQSSFHSLVRQLSQLTHDALAHSSVTAQEALSTANADAAASPVQVTLTVRDTQTVSSREELRAARAGISGVTTEFVDLYPACAPFPLMFDFWQEGAGWRGELRYNPLAVTDAFATSLAHSLAALLEAALEQPALALCELQGQLANTLAWTCERTGTGDALPEAGLDALLRAQVERKRGDIAIADDERQLSYDALDALVDRHAGGLRAHGVTAGELVGICLPRGIEAITIMLATIRVGAAYLPMEPDMPPARQQKIWREAGVRRVVTTAVGIDAVTSIGLQALDADALTADPTPQIPTGRALATDAPQQLAYVMYTSGSTGHPKGVAVPQGAVIRLVRATDYVDFATPMVMAQASNLAFDASTFEIWGALLNGHMLRIVPTSALLSPSTLATQVRDHGIDMMWLTAGLFNLLAQEDPGCLAGLRTVLTGGDAASAHAVGRVMACCPQVRLVNGYGPTENTTFSTTYQLHEAPLHNAGIPIGHPIAHSSTRIVDDCLAPVPDGAPGELLVGGDGLAWGYWGQPDLTAERFVPDPARPGQRLYRTGDYARATGQSPIEFLGRRDELVKLRGFRIELGDVEAAVRACVGIGPVCVIASEVMGRRSLVAYCVRTGGDAHWRQPLRRQLRQTLPEYMVPAAFVAIDTLPLNANGKVDRRRLPDPVEADLGRGVHQPPSTQMEIELAQIWADALGLEQISIHDNFFEVGGDSLMAAIIVARVERRYGVSVPVSVVLASPTLSEMVVELSIRRIEAATDEAAIEAIVADLSHEQAQQVELHFP